jgi:hypothetical protein
MKAHVICLNDFPDHVVIGIEGDAQAVLVARRQEYFDRNPSQWRASFEDETDFQAYTRFCHWHIRTVEVSGA